jgi:peptidoglycan/xylan/chitin deacetylase (PgdA/CDA1 family)
MPSRIGEIFTKDRPSRSRFAPIGAIASTNGKYAMGRLRRRPKGFTGLRHQLKQATLRAVYHSGLYRLISKKYSGLGTIFLMHKVVRTKTDSLATSLTITSDFLNHLLAELRTMADFLTLDEVHKRLIYDKPKHTRRPFIALTFDDGFRDNLTLALPILRRHRVPATIYVPSGAPDRILDAWPWRLEKAVRNLNELSVDLPGFPRRIPTGSWAEKLVAFRMLTEHIHRDVPTNRHVCDILLPKVRVSDEALLAEQFADWGELRELASDPLITIGGHSVTHASLRHLDEEKALAEIEEGRQRLMGQLQVRVSHFAYPYGQSTNFSAREFPLVARAGFVTATTNIKGNIFHQHREYLMCLPRIGLGDAKEEISSAILHMSGAPIALGSRWSNPVVTA